MHTPSIRDLAARPPAAVMTSLFHILALLALITPVAVAQTSTPLADGLLGLSLPNLQARLPKLQRATPPVRGPRGLRGTRVVTGDYWQGFALESTFFFRDQNVVRIEQRGLARQAETCQAGWEQRLADTLDQRWGPSLSSTEDTGTPDWQRATVWVQGALQARLLAGAGGSPARCTVLLVLEPYAPQDASSL
ncbi:MAG: hypothetical protein U5M53_08670 [Rhodoferax sp.]|nr:hypothetical protein [Rhodoferax sp.]